METLGIATYVATERTSYLVWSGVAHPTALKSGNETTTYHGCCVVPPRVSYKPLKLLCSELSLSCLYFLPWESTATCDSIVQVEHDTTLIGNKDTVEKRQACDDKTCRGSMGEFNEAVEEWVA